MSNPIKGIVAVISNYGVGKTTFALECGYHPKDMIFINDDVKTTGFEEGFKTYIDLVSETNELSIVDAHEKTVEIIKKLPKSKVIIWDTWTQFQASFPVYVRANTGKFRASGEYSAMGKIKAGEIYQDAYRYEGSVLSHLKSKCDLLILTFHIKQHYENNVAIPGKFKPAHDKAIEKYADMRVWLTPNPGSQVPAGLILKNISKREITKKGIRTNQVLPLRVPICNWDSVLQYWNEPIGNRNPERLELPNQFELSLIDGSLTDEDKRMYEVSLNAPKEEEVELVNETVKEGIVTEPPAVDNVARQKWIDDIMTIEGFPKDGNPANKAAFINAQIKIKELNIDPVTVPELLGSSG